MAKVRKDGRGRVLHKGESYLRSKSLYCFSYTDSFGNRRFIYANDLEQLREKETRFIRDRIDGMDTYLAAKASINYVFDRYMSTKTDLRGKTKAGYLYTYDRYVRNGFGKRRIGDVRYSDVLQFYLDLISNELGISTIEHINSLLRSAFKVAIRDNVIRSNPTDDVMHEVKRMVKEKPAKRALTIEEQRAFINYLNKPEYIRWKPLFTVMFGTGCRIGELIGLRWSDLDFESSMISINHSIVYYSNYGKSEGRKCRYEVGLPKTEAGIRMIPMLNEVREAFLQEKRNQEESGCLSIVEIGGMSGFIFCNRFGNIHNQAALNHEIKHLVDNYNAEEMVKARHEGRKPLMLPRFSCHTTRHTFCTRLCENETNIKVIQSVMGHKNIQTTLDIYADVSERKKEEIFRNLNYGNIF
ncbi:MAG: site-specific integrase [Lachnospiraceae bacterium]|nr:site-specific integrase [Lachnospiraceae bacterium]